MSSFICEHCGAEILDTEQGYITGCRHYPPDVQNVLSFADALRKRQRDEQRKIKRTMKEMTS